MRIKWFVAILLVVLLLFWILHTLVSTVFPFQYREEISKSCEEYHLDPAFVSAVICAESKFDPNAKSHKGAIGLMQIMEETGLWVSQFSQLGDVDLYSPRDNIRVGCAYLKMLLEQYDGSEFLALCAYNAGEGRVDSWLSQANDRAEFESLLFEETKNYCTKIEDYKKVYAILYWRNEK